MITSVAYEAVPLLVTYGFIAFFLLNMMIWFTIDETLHEDIALDVKKG